MKRNKRNKISPLALSEQQKVIEDLKKEVSELRESLVKNENKRLSPETILKEDDQFFQKDKVEKEKAPNIDFIKNREEVYKNVQKLENELEELQEDLDTFNIDEGEVRGILQKIKDVKLEIMKHDYGYFQKDERKKYEARKSNEEIDRLSLELETLQNDLNTVTVREKEVRETLQGIEDVKLRINTLKQNPLYQELYIKEKKKPESELKKWVKDIKKDLLSRFLKWIPAQKNSIIKQFEWAGSNVSGANLSNLDFKGVDLTKIKAHSTDFSGADLKGVSLEKAELCYADFTGIRIDRSTSFRGAEVQSAIFDADQIRELEKIGLKGPYAIAYPDGNRISRKMLTDLITNRYLSLIEALNQLKRDELRAERVDGPNFSFDFNKKVKSILTYKERFEKFDFPREVEINLPIEEWRNQINQLVEEGGQRQKVREKSSKGRSLERGSKKYIQRALRKRKRLRG